MPNTLTIPYDIQGTYLLFGEEFLIDQEDGALILHHPRWSLVGSGPTLAEAEQDLLARAEILLQAYSSIPKSELSDEAQQMLEFLRNIA